MIEVQQNPHYMLLGSTCYYDCKHFLGLPYYPLPQQWSDSGGFDQW